MPWGIVTIIASVVVVLVVGAFIAALAVSTLTGKQIVIQPAGLIGTPDQRAVRAWLRENSDSGRYEEVKWFPAKDYPSDAMYLDQNGWHPLGGQRVVRLKRREQFGGGKVLIDESFVISGKTVVRTVSEHTQIMTKRAYDKAGRDSEEFMKDPFKGAK